MHSLRLDSHVNQGTTVILYTELFYTELFYRMLVKCHIMLLTLHRANVGSVGFSNEHDAALPYLKREVFGVYTRIKRGEIFFDFPESKLGYGVPTIATY